MFLRTTILIVALAGALGAPGAAAAQEPDAPPEPAVRVIEPLVVHAVPATPGVSVLLRRAEVGERAPELRTSFVPRVLRSVTRSPF